VHKKLVALGLAVAAIATVAACGSGNGSNASTGSVKAGTLDGKGGRFVYLVQGSSATVVKSMENSIVKAFDDKYNYKTLLDTSCCGIDTIKSMVATGNMKYSAVNFLTYADYLAAKKADLLVKLDPKIIPVDLLRKGSYDAYGYEAFDFAPVLAYMASSYPDPATAPSSFADAFDAERFPGKRCLYNGSQAGGTLEGALEAAGTPTSDLYPIDYHKAFAQLSKIKHDTVWWTEGAQAAQFLRNGTCKIAVLWNGVAQSTALDGADIKAVWKDAPIIPQMNAIPKDTPNPEGAQAFLAEFLTNKQALAQMLAKTAYPPALKSLALPETTLQWAPIGSNFDAGFLQNQQWYIHNGAEATKRFNNYIVTGTG
jgi:putative spermidine/putrescine transport system substrate-binding protein